ncbi:MAG: pitrilysin family protein [Alphaproteobacteria bacterium]
MSIMSRLFTGLTVLALAISPTTSQADVPIEVVTSPKGITAWLVEDNSLPLVSVQFTFDAGSVQEPEGKEGVAILLASMLNEGAGDLDSEAYQQALEQDGIRFGFDAGSDYFGGHLKAHTEVLDDAIRLAAMGLNDPRFDQEPLDRMRRGLIANMRREVSRPSWAAWRAVDVVGYEGHAYSGFAQGTETSLGALTADDLRAWKRENLTLEGLEIAVVGDISAEKLAPALDQIFGGLAERPTNRQSVPFSGVRNTGKRVLVEKDIPQAEIIILQTGPKRSDPDWWAMRVANHILGGGGFGSRLTEELREKRGLTYGVYSWMSPKDHTAQILASTSVAPDKVAEALDLMLAEWERMASGEVTEEELTAAKTYLAGALALRMTSTNRVASILRGIKDEGLGVDYLDKRNAIIDAITAEDVQRAARKWLAARDELLIVVAGQPEGFEPDVTFTLDQLTPLIADQASE